MGEGLLAGKELSVLIDDVVGVGHFPQYVDERSFGRLFDLFCFHAPFGHAFLDLMCEFFSAAADGLLQLL
jgi:hypothetical protein